MKGKVEDAPQALTHKEALILGRQWRGAARRLCVSGGAYMRRRRGGGGDGESIAIIPLLMAAILEEGGGHPHHHPMHFDGRWTPFTGSLLGLWLAPLAWLASF